MDNHHDFESDIEFPDNFDVRSVSSMSLRDNEETHELVYSLWRKEVIRSYIIGNITISHSRNNSFSCL